MTKRDSAQFGVTDDMLDQALEYDYEFEDDLIADAGTDDKYRPTTLDEYGRHFIVEDGAGIRVKRPDGTVLHDGA